MQFKNCSLVCEGRSILFRKWRSPPVYWTMTNMSQPCGTSIPKQTKFKWTCPSLRIQAYQKRQKSSEYAQDLRYKHTKRDKTTVNMPKTCGTSMSKETKLQWICPRLAVQAYQKRQNYSEYAQDLPYKHTKRDKTTVNMPKTCGTSIPKQTKLQWICPKLAVHAYQNRQNYSEYVQNLRYKRTKRDKTPVKMHKTCGTSIPKETKLWICPRLAVQAFKNRQNSSESMYDPRFAVQAYINRQYSSQHFKVYGKSIPKRGKNYDKHVWSFLGCV